MSSKYKVGDFDLDGGEVDTLYKLYWFGSQDDGDLPSKCGMDGLINKGLATKNYKARESLGAEYKPNDLSITGYGVARKYYKAKTQSLATENKELKEALAYYSVPDNYNALKSMQSKLEAAEKDAKRYRYLRGRDLDTINNGGVFAGITPDNFILTGDDLDEAVDKALSTTKED